MYKHKKKNLNKKLGSQIENHIQKYYLVFPCLVLLVSFKRHVRCSSKVKNIFVKKCKNKYFFNNFLLMSVIIIMYIINIS